MAITHATRHVGWNGTHTDTDSVAGGASVDSDEFNLDDTAIAARVQVKADGTAAAGETLDVWVLETMGDTDADSESADEFVTSGHGEYLGRLDVNTDDPAQAAFQLPVPQKGAQLRVRNNGSNAMTVSARIIEQRA